MWIWDVARPLDGAGYVFCSGCRQLDELTLRVF